MIWFDLDQKWFGFDLIICDLRFWFKSFLQMICDLICDLLITAFYPLIQKGFCYSMIAIQWMIQRYWENKASTLTIFKTIFVYEFLLTGLCLGFDHSIIDHWFVEYKCFPGKNALECWKCHSSVGHIASVLDHTRTVLMDRLFRRYGRRSRTKFRKMEPA